MHHIPVEDDMRNWYENCRLSRDIAVGRSRFSKVLQVLSDKRDANQNIWGLCPKRKKKQKNAE